MVELSRKLPFGNDPLVGGQVPQADLVGPASKLPLTTPSRSTPRWRSNARFLDWFVANFDDLATGGARQPAVHATKNESVPDVVEAQPTTAAAEPPSK